MKKVFISILLSITLLLNNFSVVFAYHQVEHKDPIIISDAKLAIYEEIKTGQTLTPEQQILLYQKLGYSSEELAQVKEKLYKNDFVEIPQNKTRAYSWYEFSGFQHHYQEADNYCTVACTQMTLQYLTGILYAQEHLDEVIGIFGNGKNVSFMIPALEQYQSKNNYVFRSGESVSFSTFQNHMLSSVKTYDAPATLGLYCMSWPYAGVNDAHAVTVRGVTSDASALRIADPWYENPSSYVVNMRVAYNNINTHSSSGYVF